MDMGVSERPCDGELEAWAQCEKQRIADMAEEARDRIDAMAMVATVRAAVIRKVGHCDVGSKGLLMPTFADPVIVPKAIRIPPVARLR